MEETHCPICQRSLKTTSELKSYADGQVVVDSYFCFYPLSHNPWHFYFTKYASKNLIDLQFTVVVNDCPIHIFNEPIRQITSIKRPGKSAEILEFFIEPDFPSLDKFKNRLNTLILYK